MCGPLHIAQRTSKASFLVALVIGLALPAFPTELMAHPSEPSMNPPRISGTPLPSTPFASAAPYDEQVGVTFTQDFSALVFNVSAVAFTDSGIGPAYLVNGLTDRGYWYQVGLSYNWPMANGAVNPGFSMNYEVFNSNQASIDPPGGGGGIQPFNGPLYAGDSVQLSLNFSSGFVIMQAIDWQTGSIASQSFTAFVSKNVFVGLRSSLAQLGFFSGLMTEQYHNNRYTGAGSPVTYSVNGSRISSAWMWMDEFNVNTFEPVFEANTSLPVSLSEAVGHYFSSNGTAEIASANRFVTGLTPVDFPSLLAGSHGTGQPGHRASLNIAVEDQAGATIRFENFTVSTSFGKYNLTLGTPFSFGPGLGQYILTIDVPAGLPLGIYNVTINVMSWAYLDAQAQVWVPLHQGVLNETLLITNSPPAPNPPNNPSPSPPPSGQGPSRSTNNATFFTSSLLTIFRSLIIPVLGGYTALGLVAVVLLLRQKRRRSGTSPILGLRFCSNCGRELGPQDVICSQCNFSASGFVTGQGSLASKQDLEASQSAG